MKAPRQEATRIWRDAVTRGKCVSPQRPDPDQVHFGGRLSVLSGACASAQSHNQTAQRRTAGPQSPRFAVVALLAFVAFGLFGCYYAEMRDDEAVQAYNEEFPQMPKKTIPVGGGIWVERGAIPSELSNPLADDPRMRVWGWERYRFYCVHCHGPKLDGNGTVGQSFAPLPANLKSSQVQELTDGEIFYRIRFGFNRHPPLYATVTDNETWAIVRYIRSEK